MPNYFGVLDDMESKMNKAKTVLIDGTLSAYLKYYNNELHRTTYLNELTIEVNEACEIAISEAVSDAKCHASFLQTRFDEDGLVSFDFNSEKLGNLGTIEVGVGEDEVATLFISKNKMASVLNLKTISDLKEYVKHLEQIEGLLSEHGLEVMFV